MNQEYTVTLSSSTKGYHVYVNEERGLKLYFPKGDFEDQKTPPQTLTVNVKG